MSDERDDEVHLATLTRLWLFPRYLYRLGDKALDTPVNLRGVAWALLLSSFGPIEPLTAKGAGLIPRLIVPSLLVWLILTKVAHGAKPWEVVWSWTRLGWYRRPRKTTSSAVVLTSCIRTPH
jgi:hypothetical protein